MGLMEYLIDTNILSDYITGCLSQKARELLESIELNVSVITELEMLCWKTEYEKEVKEFVATLNVLDITEDVKRWCVQLKKGKKIKLPDAIIAATALAGKYTLLTDNEKDFEGIGGLRVENPYKIG